MEDFIKKTILIVEDAGIDRDIVTLFLQEKYNIVSAENGLVAERILESGQQVSLILLDIVMPMVDGFGFLNWIQERPVYQHIPIVFTSLEATDENILKGLKMGIRDVIVKPYDWDEVTNRVDNLIALTEARVGHESQPRNTHRPGCNTALIVDDSELNRDIIKVTLDGVYDFLEAGNGLEALELLRTRGDEICLVLLDLLMPEMDGYEMMKAANRENLVQYIPVVAVTTEESPTRHLQLLEAGVCEVVQKPFSPAIIQSRLDNLVELYHSRRQTKR